MVLPLHVLVEALGGWLHVLIAECDFSHAHRQSSTCRYIGGDLEFQHSLSCRGLEFQHSLSDRHSIS